MRLLEQATFALKERSVGSSINQQTFSKTARGELTLSDFDHP
jgi:hypothetical protein